jgi:hypothetical protein
MSSAVINTLKKDESIFNKQLLIIDSGNRKSDETATSFTNVFEKSDRIVKMEILDCNIPNTIYNISNDGAVMDIDVSLLNGNKNNEKLIVSDEEIKNNIIIDTNIINGSVMNHNFITSVSLNINEITTSGLFIYVSGSFKNELVEFYNTDNVTPISNILEINQNNNIFVVCYNIDSSFKWRLKITGNLSNNGMEMLDDGFYIYGKTNTNIHIYNINDNLIIIPLL